jgi:hypothetical protein
MPTTHPDERDIIEEIIAPFEHHAKNSAFVSLLIKQIKTAKSEELPLILSKAIANLLDEKEALRSKINQLSQK